MYKTLDHALPWTKRTQWKWPAGDKKLVQVFDHVSDIDHIMEFVKNTQVCVQAGGACGIWPLRFSQLFDHVVTFEPQMENFSCLLKNVSGTDNISAINAPLASDHEKYSIHNDIQERENWGAGYVVPDESGIRAWTIDEIGLRACDLIQLDIEGKELDALKGAHDTISRFKPIIVLEEKRLNHVPGDHTKPRRWLQETFGYHQVGSIHRDVILEC